jgi:hypothetical protein
VAEGWVSRILLRLKFLILPPSFDGLRVKIRCTGTLVYAVHLPSLQQPPRVTFYAFSALKGEHAYSGDCGHPFRRNAASDSERMRSPVPGESGHVSERSDAGGSIVYELIPDGSPGVKFSACFFRMDSPLRVMV